MSRLTKFEEYRDRYSDCYVLEKTDDGILLMRMHTDGGPVNWNKAASSTPNLLGDIAGDRDVRVVIYTGTGENFNADFRPKGEQLKAYAAQLQAAPQRPAEDVEASGWSGRNRHNNMLDIDAIMIAAVNGPVTIHSELPLMCDIVLASEKAYFQDLAHFVSNLAPGDGVQNIWPRAIGMNRFRYWQLMGQKITAQQAYDWGAVNEVVPNDKLLDRAWEIARYLVRFSPVTLRNTRRIFVQELKRAAVNDLALGQNMELLGMTSIHPDPLLWDGGVLPD
ncbi:MAG: enoyl-CoA hydratase/isomerase family protein [Acidimicrobiales bacterium]